MKYINLILLIVAGLVALIVCVLSIQVLENGMRRSGIVPISINEILMTARYNYSFHTIFLVFLLAACALEYRMKKYGIIAFFVILSAFLLFVNLAYAVNYMPDRPMFYKLKPKESAQQLDSSEPASPAR